MFTGEQVSQLLQSLGVTHVVWLPDSTLGQWEPQFRSCRHIELITVCREGEAWAVAAGLHLGGANPLVMIQCTGLFESGDALRNVLHDYRLPIFAFVGYRSYFNQETLPGDTALKFAEPILRGWNLDYRLIDDAGQLTQIADYYKECRRKHRPGVALIAEGRA